MPFFAEHRIEKAMSHVLIGKWLSSKIVPIVAVNWPMQPEHLYNPTRCAFP